MVVEGSRRPGPADAAPFHAAAAAAIKAIPRTFGDWEGTDIEVPASAQALLKPNALLSRNCVDRRSGEQVGLLLVQCRDTRDMAGHFPPICYPGQGWVISPDQRVVGIQVEGRTIRAARYQFHRRTFDQERTLVVYDFFAVPGLGILIDMDAIRKTASDYTARPFGAAQVQVVLNRQHPQDEERMLVQAVLAPLAPALDVLSDPMWRRK